MLVGHIVGQFSAPILPGCSSVPPHPAEKAIIIIMVITIVIMVRTMVMIRRLAEEGGFRPVEWRWSGLPQVREREISSFWILLMLCFYYFINGRVCFVTQVYNLPTLPEWKRICCLHALPFSPALILLVNFNRMISWSSRSLWSSSTTRSSCRAWSFLVNFNQMISRPRSASDVAPLWSRLQQMHFRVEVLAF